MSLPQATFQLPSAGVLAYPAEVTLRSWTVKEEKVMFSSTRDSIYKVLESCIVEPKAVNIDDMLLADLNYLFVMLRVVSLGSDYKVTHKCPHCGTLNEFQVDLQELPVDYLPDDFVEPFYVSLPINGGTVALRLLRAKDSKEITREMNRAKARNKDTLDTQTYVLRLAKHIVSYNDEPLEPKDKMEFVESISAQDVDVIWSAIGDIKVGIDTLIADMCSKCEESFSFYLPVGPSFFRPGIYRGGEGAVFL